MRATFLPIAILLAPACGGTSASTFAEPAQSPENPSRPGRVTVERKELRRDRSPWSPHGLNPVAFVQAPAAQPGGCDEKTFDVFQSAWNRYQEKSSALFQELRECGAGTVRIQVAQDGLDPQKFGIVTFFEDASAASTTNSSFAGKTCGEEWSGPGKTMQSWFRSGMVPTSPE